MQLFLNEVSARHPDERIVMVSDSAGVFHGLPAHAQQEGGLRVLDQLLHQVHALDGVVRWRRKARRHPG